MSLTPFAPLIGQNQAVELLTSAVKQNRIAPAYLFAGSSGVGRRLAAACFSELLLTQNAPAQQHPLIQKRLHSGNHPDLLWLQPTYFYQGKLITAHEAVAAGITRKAPPQVRIEQVREIAEFLANPPLEASRSVVVIEETQTMAEAAANALLKTLEAPQKATLILIAPGTDSLLPTLVSRCQRIPFYRLGQQQMKQVLQQTGHEAILDDQAVLAIAQGSPGDAIFSQAQLQTISGELRQKLIQFPKLALTEAKHLPQASALKLATEVAQNLDTPTQLWLVDYLQHHYWQQFLKDEIPHSPLQKLEETRQALLSYAQPHLVWEVILLSLCQTKH